MIFLQMGYGIKNNLLFKSKRLENGGAGRDRTDDLRLAKPALSQLSYSPPSLLFCRLLGRIVFLEGE